jgi:catechol 2,3-dioxygenase-like lactoylglutathione lyase family enzyme
MLGTKIAMATVAVKDMEAARKFYEEAIGLQLAEKQEPGTLVYSTGSSRLLVYESQYAGSNQATAVTWNVGDDLEDIVRDLKTRGVVFEHYDLPAGTRSGDIHVFGDLRVAWFKDPDGNIHSMGSG